MIIDYELKNNFINGNLAFYCGAGFSPNFSSSKTWTEFIKDVYSDAGEDFSRFVFYNQKDGNIAPSELIKLAEMYDIIAQKKNKARLSEIICREFSEFRATRNLAEWNTVKDLPVDIFITTNYDLAIENLFENDIDVITFPEIIVDYKSTRKLYKLHGSVDYPESIIITLTPRLRA